MRLINSVGRDPANPTWLPEVSKPVKLCVNRVALVFGFLPIQSLGNALCTIHTSFCFYRTLCPFISQRCVGVKHCVAIVTDLSKKVKGNDCLNNVSPKSVTTSRGRECTRAGVVTTGCCSVSASLQFEVIGWCKMCIFAWVVCTALRQVTTV